MTTTIPCKARDPRTCPYHGAELRMQDALREGNGDAFLKAQDDMAKAAHTTPEIQTYFQENPTASTHYAPAAATFETRFDTAMEYLDDVENGSIHPADINYPVGGPREQLTYQPSTAARRAYQTMATIILTHAQHPDARNYTPGMRVIANIKDIQNDLRKRALWASQAGKDTLADTYRSLSTNVTKNRIPGGDYINVREALQNLDDAYWETPTSPAYTKPLSHKDQVATAQQARENNWALPSGATWGTGPRYGNPAITFHDGYTLEANPDSLTAPSWNAYKPDGTYIGGYPFATYDIERYFKNPTNPNYAINRFMQDHTE